MALSTSVWFDRLKITIIKLGYQPTKSDNSLFIQDNKESMIYILIYVDGLIITGNGDTDVNNLIQCQDKKFSIKDLRDLGYFWA